MEKAYKCDKCGKYFDKLNLEVQKIEKTKNKHDIYLVVQSYSAKSTFSRYEKDTLCKECQKKFALELIKAYKDQLEK